MVRIIQLENFLTYSLYFTDMVYTIVDCYTDEPAGLGVPPYLGTYPRYVAGYLNEDVTYLTIDDLRLWKKHNSVVKETKLSQKTDITTYNLTANYRNVGKILNETDTLIIILGDGLENLVGLLDEEPGQTGMVLG